MLMIREGGGGQEDKITRFLFVNGFLPLFTSKT